MSPLPKIHAFDFSEGRILAKKYEVVKRLGTGWEGEVYLLKERGTGIERAGKFFFPHRNLRNRAVIRYARKLHKLRHCPILIQYLSQETIYYKRQPITFLVSELVEGELLSEFLKHRPGKRLTPFQGIHLLYALVKGMEKVHREREYHGDLHPENIIIQRFGLKFELKILDMYHWDHSFSRPENIRDDLCDMIKILYESLGGRKYYAKQPQAIKEICCGLKKSLILKKFRSSTKLREYLEHFQWN